MTFTDDDLKRLKEQLADPKLKQWREMANRTNLDGLLARLEAAEDILDFAGPVSEQLQFQYGQAVQAWRKAKGEK